VCPVCDYGKPPSIVDHCASIQLGFRTRELLSCMNGPPLKRTLPGYHVRAAALTDLAACNTVCFDDDAKVIAGNVGELPRCHPHGPCIGRLSFQSFIDANIAMVMQT
jgi:hypothetical protein